MNHLYLGIDVGTSSSKATVIDSFGNIISQTKVSNTLLNPTKGYFEVDPINSWWNGFLKICLDLKEFLPQINSVCISSVCGSFVPTDENFNPTYNAIMYGIDTRAINQLKRMNQDYEEKELNLRMGGKFTTHSVLPKILWIKENLPQVYQKSKHFLESNNFITAKLTNTVAWDFPSAAAARLVDSTTKTIPKDICEKYEIDYTKIPNLKWPLSPLGKVTKKAAEETGLPQGITVFTGACDVNAEALSTFSAFPGETICVFGSTISMLHTMKEQKQLKGFISGFSLLEDTYRLGAATSSGVRFLSKIDSFFNFTNHLDTKGISPSPSGLLMLPYIDGARTPFDDPKAKGTIYGINGQTDRDSIFLGSREALGYEIFLLINKIEKTGEKINIINCTGGLSENSSVMQIISNITGKKLQIHEGINASFGDGIIALTSNYSLKEIINLPGIIKLRNNQKIITPEKEISKQYNSLTKQYLKLYPTLKTIEI